jgi:hypothetical protein
MKEIFKGLLILTLFSIHYDCTAQTHVTGGAETYKFWAGTDPDSTMKVLNGEYWSYGHFTKEYKLYMEIKVKPTTAKYFVTDNNLKAGKYEILNGAPKWFKPPKDFEVWDGRQGSKYYINAKTGHIYMYEVQL